MAIQIAFKILGTGVLLFLIYLLWTNEIDVRKTIMRPLASIVHFKTSSTFDVNFADVMGARFVLPGNTSSGNFGLLFYQMTFVNRSTEAVTIKEIVLRYKVDGVYQTKDSYVLQTSKVGSGSDVNDAIVAKVGPANIVLVGWQNMRTVINSFNTISAGGVLRGSAAFIFDVKDVETFSKIEHIELVAVDFAGKQSVKELNMHPNWIESARISTVSNTGFEIDWAGKVRPK